MSDEKHEEEPKKYECGFCFKEKEYVGVCKHCGVASVKTEVRKGEKVHYFTGDDGFLYTYLQEKGKFHY